jgi:ketosteroid isomerase-like protein
VDAEGVAEALFAAVERGDVDAVAALYTDDAVHWHNFDGIAQPRDQTLLVLAWMARNLTGLRYEEVKRYEIDGGFVQQHVLRATTPSGKELSVPCCMVVQLHHGKIVRVDEYLDSAQLSPLRS